MDQISARREEILAQKEVVAQFSDQIAFQISAQREEVLTQISTHREEVLTQIAAQQKQIASQQDRIIAQVSTQFTTQIEEMEKKLQLEIERRSLLEKSGNGQRLIETTVGPDAVTVTNRVKPPTFDGKTSWPNYLKQFEAASKANGWTSKDKVVALTVAPRGDALNILQAIPEGEVDSYDHLVKRLDMRYGHEHLQQVFNHK